MAMSSTYFSHTGCFQDKYINETDEILRMILLKTKGENNSDKAKMPKIYSDLVDFDWSMHRRALD